MLHLLDGCWNSWVIDIPSKTQLCYHTLHFFVLSHWVLGEFHSQIFGSLISSSTLLRFMLLSCSVGFLKHRWFLIVGLPLGLPHLRRSRRHCLAECASIWVSGHGSSHIPPVHVTARSGYKPEGDQISEDILKWLLWELALFIQAAWVPKTLTYTHPCDLSYLCHPSYFVRDIGKFCSLLSVHIIMNI